MHNILTFEVLIVEPKCLILTSIEGKIIAFVLWSALYSLLISVH